MTLKNIAVIGLCLAALSCTRKENPTIVSQTMTVPIQQTMAQTVPALKANPGAPKPEDVVKRFIEFSASAKETRDKERLQDLCVGELKRAFERMTEESFRISYINTSIKIDAVKILDSSLQNEGAKVHYEVTVENKQGTDTTHEVNEREVDLALSQGTWYIESIRVRGSDKIAFTRGMIF